MILSPLHTAFFALLRAGLLHKPVALRGEIPWQEVYTLATQQSMLGIVFDGVSLLPEEQQPPKALLIKWMGIVAHLEQKNELLNQRVVELQALYEAEHIPFVLLKGQGLALNYPNPDHRTCGDMDVFVGEDYNEISIGVLKRNGGLLINTGIKDTVWTWGNAIIENHFIIDFFNSKSRNRDFQQWIKNWFPEKTNNKIINNKNIQVPPVVFNIVFLLHHLLRHTFMGGVGLRQVLDFLLFMREEARNIDAHLIKQKLIHYDLYILAQCITYIGVCYLGFDLSEIPIELPPKKQLSQIFLDDVLKSGNFGKNDKMPKNHSKTKWGSKWFYFRKTVYRIIRLHKLAPNESWAFIRFMVEGQIRVVLKGKNCMMKKNNT